MIGGTLLGHGDFIKGTGHASFLSPLKDGHGTPFVAILLGPKLLCLPPVDGSYKALDHILNQSNARGLLIQPLWVRLNSYHRLFPDENHLIPQVIGWTLLNPGDIVKGIGHASFLSPDRGDNGPPLWQSSWIHLFQLLSSLLPVFA